MILPYALQLIIRTKLVLIWLIVQVTVAAGNARRRKAMCLLRMQDMNLAKLDDGLDLKLSLRIFSGKVLFDYNNASKR